jgi:ankyrin repeat protein
MSHGCTPLILAARYDYNNYLPLLLCYNSDPDATDDSRMCALHWAAQVGNASAIRVLLPVIKNPNAKNLWGFTPLMLAVKGGDLKTVQYLLSPLVDVDSTDSDGNTALDMAQHSGNTQIVRLLRCVGASTGAQVRSK